MAFEVETGNGSATATSYDSVANADAYHADRGDPVAWSGASDPRKEQGLIAGTDYLDQVYGLRWDGTRKERLQALDWPRINAVDWDGWTVQSDEIPQAIKNALAELAIRDITETNGLLPDVASGDREIERDRVKVGPIELDTTYTGPKPQLKRFTIVEKLVAPYISATGTLQRA